MLNRIVPVCMEELARLRGLVSVQQRWAVYPWVTLGMLNLIVPVCTGELARLRGLVGVQQWAFGSSCSFVWASLSGLVFLFGLARGARVCG